MRGSALLFPSLVCVCLTAGGNALDDSCTKAGSGCLNEGLCLKTTHQITGATELSCLCPSGTAGELCESAGVCDLQCRNSGSCRYINDDAHRHSGTSSFECECVGPYKGVECEIPVATCPMNGGPNGASAECLWGGTCMAEDDIGDFTCICPTGRSGASCETEDAAPAGTFHIVKSGTCLGDGDCANGGLCVLSHDAAATAEAGVPIQRSQCVCALGWGGASCARPCPGLHCQHGSSCRFDDPSEDDDVAADANDDRAYCECDRARFKGTECEVAVQRCPGIGGVECLHGGGCVAVSEDSDFYACACPPGRLGARCEQRDLDYHGVVTETLSVPKEGIDPILFIGVVVSVALLIFLPLTVMIIKRSNRREAEVQRFDAEMSNVKGTAHASTGDDSNGSAGQPKDAQFV